MSLAGRLSRVAVAIVALFAAALASAKTTPATVDQPRPFGYVVGDIVTQRVLLTTPKLEFDPIAPPIGQRVSIWFERRASSIESAADGRRWLIVDYQVINAPPTLTTIQLPAWELEGKQPDARLRVPPASISVAPLVANSSAPTVDSLMPDRQPPITATGPARARLLLWSIAFGAVLAGWLAWFLWRNWRDSLDQPFARALRQVRRVDEMAPEAWQALHRAFDQTAGRTLQLQTLPTLFERAPHLQPRRAEIERFFAQSSERFFGAGLPGDALSVRALCNDLRRIERRHAR